MLGADRAELGDRHLEVGEHFQQEGLEGLVGAIQLVDEQHGSPGGRGLQSAQQGALDEIALGQNVVFKPVAVGFAGRFREADRHHLLGIIPLIDSRGDIEPLVALQADERSAEGRGENLGNLGLADASLAFEEQRPFQAQRQEQDSRQRPVGHIIGGGQQAEGFIDGTGQWAGQDAEPLFSGRT